jgi:uncharacterized membrane protein
VTEHESGHDQPGDSGRAAYRPEQPAASSPPPGTGRAQPQHGQQQQLPSAKGFIGSLFDFGFASFVTPKVIRVLYPLIVIVAALSALGFIATAFAASTVFGIVTLFVLAPLFFLVVVAIYRVLLEFFMVIFRISDDIRTIRERGDLR